MKYRVEWTPDAESLLAKLWLGSRMRQQIQAKIDRLENLLSVHGSNLGESREGLLRVVFDVPLGVEFLVLDDEKLVVISDIWVF